jgi:SAM-dependent methyltransferase
MKRRLLDWILCPACGERPRLDVLHEEEVAIAEPVPRPACSRWCALYEYADFFARHGRAPDGSREQPRPGRIAAGAPRTEPVADERSPDSFRLQWAIYQEGDLTWFKDDAGLRKRELLYNLEVTPEELAGRTLLDAGCGNGELTRAMAEYGLEVVGMDFSRSVEGARRRLFERGFPVAHRVHYLQGNALELPLAPASFDFVHSSGVLHHTPSTHRGMRSVSRAVAPGGKLYVQLYRRRPAWIHYINVTLRAVTTRLPLALLYKLCYLGAPVHAALSRLVHALRGETAPTSTRRERAVQMFDNYSPRYQYRHTVPEIAGFMRELGFADVKDVTLENEARHMLAVLGRRLPAGEAAEARAGAAGGGGRRLSRAATASREAGSARIRPGSLGLGRSPGSGRDGGRGESAGSRATAARPGDPKSGEA